MKNASKIEIAEGFQQIPSLLGGFRSADFPEERSTGHRLDGLIRVDGVFVLEDGTWNPSLCGWACLVEFNGERAYTVRFEAGRVVDVRRGLDCMLVDRHPLSVHGQEWVNVPVVMLDRL